MKHAYLRWLLASLCLLTSTAAAWAQTGSVGIGTTTPAASAVLDLTSTTQGLLPPRLTQAQRGAIANPAAGLLVFQTDATPGLYQYTALGWVALNADSQLTTPAPVAAVTLVPTTTTVNYADNASATQGVVTLGAGTEGQRLVIINNDAQYLTVVSGSSTGNILPHFGARYLYAGGAWRRES